MMTENRRFLVGLARASAGALLFSLPMLLTMEMWSIGATASPLRMAILHLVSLPALYGLAKFSGFEKQDGFVGLAVDVFVAYAVGWTVSVAILSSLALLDITDMSVIEIFGNVAVQTVSASIGAVFASSQLGTSEDSDEADDTDRAGPIQQSGYFRELFIMAAGALFLALNVAPTEEILLVAFKMSAWHAIVLTGLSLAIMHAFVFVVKFRGQEDVPEEQSAWSVFLRFTIPGYAIALLVSLFCLWSFGTTTSTSSDEVAMATAVLGLPAALGAASARLIL